MLCGLKQMEIVSALRIEGHCALKYTTAQGLAEYLLTYLLHGAESFLRS